MTPVPLTALVGDAVMWTIEEARAVLIPTLQAACRPLGYHVALGGGVLNKGYSEKDLDLYFLPFCGDTDPAADPAKLMDLLVDSFGDATPIGGSHNHKYGPDENTLSWINGRWTFTTKGRRIDVFIA